MEENENLDLHPGDKDEIYANAVRAGKRTYFFDVRKTKSEEFYLTITESKRRYNEDGTYFYQKHKIFLYKEDFDKFMEALNDSIKKVDELNSGNQSNTSSNKNGLTDISFDSLGSTQE